MLILFGRDRSSVPIKTEALRVPRCDFVAHVEAYTARQIGPEACAAFELHLIECGSCQRAVHLGRISNRLYPHNRSVGMPCAAHNRRNS
jgi:hypothetical protein